MNKTISVVGLLDYGEKIRTLRKKHKLSAEKLGNLIGLSQSMISKLENGERNLDVNVLELICSALGLTIAEFFAEDKEPEPLNPDLQQVFDKIKRLSPRQLKILGTVLDEWKTDPSTEGE